MKALITTFGLVATMSFGLASTSAVAASMQGWADCNSQYAACLRDGSNMSMATDVNSAISQGSANVSNWASCNSALAACYQSLN